MTAPEPAEPIERWRHVWRAGLAPMLPLVGLEALELALEEDAPTLIQGASIEPPPLMCVAEWPPDGADAVCFTGWHSGLSTVGELWEFFARVTSEADAACGESAACRHFLNWYDDTPRERMRPELLAEVRLALLARRGPAPASDPPAPAIVEPERPQAAGGPSA